MTRTSLRPVAIVALVALIGAGCQRPAPPSTNGTTNSQAKTSMAFGKLPSMAQDGLGSDAARSARPMGAPGQANYATDLAAPAPMMATKEFVGTGGGVAMTMPARGPYYEEQKMADVEYKIEGTLPSWETQGDVLHTRVSLPNTDGTRSLLSQSGLPSNLANSMNSVSSLSAQWRDSNGGQWNFDAASRYVSFWKEMPYIEQANTNSKPTFDENAVKQAADKFLDEHGFSDIRSRGGKVLELQNILYMMKAMEDKSFAPCRMEGDVRIMKDGASTSGGVGTANAAAVATPPAASSIEPAVDSKMMAPDSMIYPGPCGGWWPQQVNVSYVGVRDGQAVSDPYGNDGDVASVTIDLRTLEATNMYLQLGSDVERSSYPLIDKEAALKRLQTGGHNPVWPWGSENGKIVVTLKTTELVWMRYDSWQKGQNDTYYIPAVRASGTIQRGNNQQTEEYHTVVPLVSDEAFETQTGIDVPPSVTPMMMKGVEMNTVAPATAPAMPTTPKPE